MDGSGHNGETGSAPSPARRAGIFIGLLVVVFAFMFWRAFSYSGLVSQLAEWQFAHLHHWFPMATALAFCALAAAVWFALTWSNRRRLMSAGRWSPSDDANERKRQLAVATSGLLILATVCGALVLSGLVYWATLPSADGTASAWNAPGVAREGRTGLAGARLVGPVARYQEAIIGIGPDQYFAPIAKQADGDVPGDFTLFAEVNMVGGKARLPANSEGILRRDAVPGELEVLYRSNGFAVAKDASVIFRTAASSGRATLVFMIEALALGLISLLAGLLLRRRYRRVYG